MYDSPPWPVPTSSIATLQPSSCSAAMTRRAVSRLSSGWGGGGAAPSRGGRRGGGARARHPRSPPPHVALFMEVRRGELDPGPHARARRERRTKLVARRDHQRLG